MVVNADKLGLSITRTVTPHHPYRSFPPQNQARRTPQLWNVFAGDMSFVGPRPEVPRYVARYTPEQREVLKLKPGITDLATLEFRNEEDLLRNVQDTEAFYVRHCIPRKIQLNLAYAEGANLWEDTKIILRTLFKSLPLRSHVEVHSALKPLPGRTL
jgi:lipopolysaccharide/colanic/teichoic acid biosynthesis glycosyltransferase